MPSSMELVSSRLPVPVRSLGGPSDRHDTQIMTPESEIPGRGQAQRNTTVLGDRLRPLSHIGDVSWSSSPSLRPGREQPEPVTGSMNMISKQNPRRHSSNGRHSTPSSSQDISQRRGAQPVWERLTAPRKAAISHNAKSHDLQPGQAGSAQRVPAWERLSKLKKTTLPFESSIPITEIPKAHKRTSTTASSPNTKVDIPKRNQSMDSSCRKPKELTSSEGDQANQCSVESSQGNDSDRIAQARTSTGANTDSRIPVWDRPSKQQRRISSEKSDSTSDKLGTSPSRGGKCFTARASHSVNSAESSSSSYQSILSSKVPDGSLQREGFRQLAVSLLSGHQMSADKDRSLLKMGHARNDNQAFILLRRPSRAGVKDEPVNVRNRMDSNFQSNDSPSASYVEVNEIKSETPPNDLVEFDSFEKWAVENPETTKHKPRPLEIESSDIMSLASSRRSSSDLISQGSAQPSLGTMSSLSQMSRTEVITQPEYRELLNHTEHVVTMVEGMLHVIVACVENVERRVEASVKKSDSLGSATEATTPKCAEYSRKSNENITKEKPDICLSLENSVNGKKLSNHGISHSYQESVQSFGPEESFSNIQASGSDSEYAYEQFDFRKGQNFQGSMKHCYSLDINKVFMPEQESTHSVSSNYINEETPVDDHHEKSNFRYESSEEFIEEMYDYMTSNPSLDDDEAWEQQNQLRLRSEASDMPSTLESLELQWDEVEKDVFEIGRRLSVPNIAFSAGPENESTNDNALASSTSIVKEFTLHLAHNHDKVTPDPLQTSENNNNQNSTKKESTSKYSDEIQVILTESTLPVEATLPATPQKLETEPGSSSSFHHAISSSWILTPLLYFTPWATSQKPAPATLSVPATGDNGGNVAPVINQNSVGSLPLSIDHRSVPVAADSQDRDSGLPNDVVQYVSAENDISISYDTTQEPKELSSIPINDSGSVATLQQVVPSIIVDTEQKSMDSAAIEVCPIISESIDIAVIEPTPEDSGAFDMVKTENTGRGEIEVCPKSSEITVASLERAEERGELSILPHLIFADTNRKILKQAIVVDNDVEQSSKETYAEGSLATFSMDPAIDVSGEPITGREKTSKVDQNVTEGMQNAIDSTQNNGASVAELELPPIIAIPLQVVDYVWDTSVIACAETLLVPIRAVRAGTWVAKNLVTTLTGWDRANRRAIASM
ncbi:hypothetical protein BJ742DRAFT_886840 [Cladochytrium replicatum]|nr:hypothetical protein BJ742DRAFT_886840 [Cladochytrium replicatum]